MATHISTKSDHTENAERQRASSSTEWQNMALDTLSRLTRQFATHPDCNKLIDLVLLSITGQLSATGAFACFLSSLGKENSSSYRGFGLLHRQENLCQLLSQQQFHKFFIEQHGPMTITMLIEHPDTPETIKQLLAETRVAAIVPLVIGDSLLGILGLAPKIDRSDYSQDDLSLLGTFSDAITPLLSNSLLYARLETLNRWHRDVLDSVRQGVLVFADDFKLKQANQRSKTMFPNLHEKSIWDQSDLMVSSIFPENTFPGWEEFIRTAAVSDKKLGVENLVVRENELERIFLVRLSRTSSQEQAIPDIIVTLDEVTKQRHNEQQMFEMEKFAEKGIMAASISHELNNFLALILGGIELAGMAVNRKDPEKLTLSMEKLRNNVEAMERFTAGLTDYSKLDSKKSETNLNSIVKNVVSFARVQKRFKKTHIQTRLEHNIPSFMADNDQIAQLLMNLLNNAADAIRDNNTTNGIIEVKTLHENSRIVLIVTDNGIGIPDEQKKKLFNTQFTTKKDGHGFGMVTCGRILKHHQATPTITSVPQEGTTIAIAFPQSDIT